MNPLRTIWEGLRTTAAGLRVTIPYIWKKPVTTQYPHQRLDLPERTRNRLYVNMDDCIGCDQCARACPVNCIDIETVKAVGDDTPGQTSQGKKKALWVTRFDIDIAKCCYCGLCVFPCPTECIWMTEIFEFAETERQDLIYNFATLTPEEIAEKKAKGEAAEKPAERSSGTPAAAPPAVEQARVPTPAQTAGDDERAAKVAELQRRMAEAKARRAVGDDASRGSPKSDAGPDSGVPPAPAPDKAAALAELQRKMAEAKARRMAGGAPDAPPTSQSDSPAKPEGGSQPNEASIGEQGMAVMESTQTPAPPQGATSDTKAAAIAELQRRMAEAKARRVAGAAADAAPSTSRDSTVTSDAGGGGGVGPDAGQQSARSDAMVGSSSDAAGEPHHPKAVAAGEDVADGRSVEPDPRVHGAPSDDKAAKIAELQRKMAEAKARREAGETGGERTG